MRHSVAKQSMYVTVYFLGRIKAISFVQEKKKRNKKRLL